MGRSFRPYHEVLITLFCPYCVVLVNFLRCWVLTLVDAGMKMHIKVIRKRLLRFHMRVTGILLNF